MTSELTVYTPASTPAVIPAHESVVRPAAPLWALMRDAPWDWRESEGKLYANELEVLRDYLIPSGSNFSITSTDLHALLTREIERARANEGANHA